MGCGIQLTMSYTQPEPYYTLGYRCSDCMVPFCKDCISDKDRHTARWNPRCALSTVRNEMDAAVHAAVDQLKLAGDAETNARLLNAWLAVINS